MKISKKILFGCFLIAISIYVSCKKETVIIEPSPTTTVLTPYKLYVPPYFPVLIIPDDNPLTVEGIELGRKLYYDTILSNNGLSCSSCHSQSLAFSNQSVNSQPHINIGWSNNFLWNGKVQGSVEDVMMFEVSVFFNSDVSKLNNHSYYPGIFKKVYNINTITQKDVAYALSQFMRRLSSTDSKFDKYLRYETMLTPSEMNGFVIFNSEKGDCFHCHSLGLFSDNSFHNIGLDSVFVGINQGRYNVSNNPGDMGKFISPTLRNVELSAPYMHDGRYSSLEEVVEHYNSKVKQSSTFDPILTKPSHYFGLQLSAQEKNDLVAFLKTLTDSTFITDTSLNNPF